MPSVSRDYVRDVVFDELRSLTRTPDLVINDTDPVIDSFGIYGDDFGSLFVLELEKRLGVRTSQSDWSRVRTIGDVIDLFVRLCNEPMQRKGREMSLWDLMRGLLLLGVLGWLFIKLIRSVLHG